MSSTTRSTHFETVCNSTLSVYVLKNRVYAQGDEFSYACDVAIAPLLCELVTITQVNRTSKLTSAPTFKKYAVGRFFFSFPAFSLKRFNPFFPEKVMPSLMFPQLQD